MASTNHPIGNAHSRRVLLSARQVGYFIILFTILFPFIRVIPLNTDVQPNFLISIFALTPFLIKIRRSELIILVCTILILLVYTIASPVWQSFRAWASYLTPVIMLIFVRSILAQPESAHFIEKFLKISFFTWVGFGALQFLTKSTIVQLTFRASTTDDRGWMSFSSEPSGFATVMFLFCAYFIVKRKYIYVSVSFLTVAVVAQSALGLVYFSILAISFFTVRVRDHILLLTFLVTLFGITYITLDLQDILDYLPEGRRITYLIDSFVHHDTQIDDASIESRMGDIFLAYDTLSQGPLFGHGFAGNIRLKSGWGAYVYELGWIGLILLVGWISFFLYKAAYAGRDVFAVAISINAMLFSSTPLAMPTSTFIILLLILAPIAHVPKHQIRAAIRECRV